MGLGLIGRKIGMTQCFNSAGVVVPVTVVEIEPGTIIQKKTKETDGYFGLQIGSGKVKKVNSPLAGHFKKYGVVPKRYLNEIRLDDVSAYEPGQELKIDIFQEGELVDVQGISKGKGFAGGVKRWGWKGGRATHGSMFHRAPGSIGQSSDPSRVWKGLHMPGRMGGKNVTIQNIKVVKIDLERNLLLLKGAVPGNKNGLVLVQKAVKKKLKKKEHQING